jgi:hypothetical protein
VASQGPLLNNQELLGIRVQDASDEGVVVQGFQPAVQVFEIQAAGEYDTLHVDEHRKVVIKMLQI